MWVRWQSDSLCGRQTKTRQRRVTGAAVRGRGASAVPVEVGSIITTIIRRRRRRRRRIPSFSSRCCYCTLSLGSAHYNSVECVIRSQCLPRDGDRPPATGSAAAAAAATRPCSSNIYQPSQLRLEENTLAAFSKDSNVQVRCKCEQNNNN